MRASTLFAVTIAILLGLAAAITVKVTGYLSQPAVTTAPKTPEINVLVAARNLYKGDMVDGGWVAVRTLRPEEIKDYEQNKEKYLPAVPNVAILRIAAVNVEADKPMLREYLIPLEETKPPPISSVLFPNMRAVNLSLSKDESVGGMIQMGEWVDVLLTTQITINGVSSTRTSPIAHKVRVIAKRNTQFRIYGPLPDDKLVHFTLEMNPYRAALLEYCRTKGVLSMVPVSAAEQKTLDEHRVAVLAGNDIQQVAFAPPKMEENSEYKQEDERVDAINKGELTIGTRDLARIFNIEIESPRPPLAEPILVKIETFGGNHRREPDVFNSDGSVHDSMRHGNVYGLVRDTVTGQLTAAPKELPSYGTQKNGVNFNAPTDIQFQLPGEKPGCKSCKKKAEGSSVP